MGGRGLPKQDVAVELYYDGAWHDIVPDDDVYADPIVIKRGQSDEGSAFRPCSIACSLANDDDIYRTSNPMSPLYGKAGRNTPLRVSVGGSVRATAEAESWSPDQTPDFRRSPRRGRSWVDLEAGGVLARVGEWTEPLRSPFEQYNTDLSTSVGYWPMQDPVGTRSLYTPTLGASSTVLQGVEFQSQTRFPGSAPMVVMPNNPNTYMAGDFVPGDVASTAGWQLSFTINFGDNGTTGDFYNFLIWYTADDDFYSLSWLDGNLLLVVETAAGASLINTSFPVDDVSDWNRWQMFIVTSTYSAGTTTISIYWMTETSDVFAGAYTATFSDVTSSLKSWQMQGGGALNDVAVGHMLGTTGTSDNLLLQDRADAFHGYSGENAADRFARLCTLKGLNYTIIGTNADSWPMGPQPVDTFPDLLKEIVTTEDGLIFDDIDDTALVLLLRTARLNQTPALQLVPTDLPALPRETTDGLNLANLVTASQRDGGDYTVEDTTGPLGTQPPPDGAGEKRQKVDVNVVLESQLPQVANWWLRLGTVNQPRYPQVVVNLAALAADMVDQVEAVDVGSVITIDGYREDLIRLYVLGWTETIDWPSARKIVFTCAPDQQYDVAVQDDTSKRQESYTSTLSTGYSASATTMVVTFSVLADQWSTVNTPYDWAVSGERIRVTAMGAVTGSGPWTQSATVIRGINGVSKAQVSGEPVHMHPEQQARQAL